MGSTIAIGLLVDTLIVRSLLMPSIATLLGLADSVFTHQCHHVCSRTLSAQWLTRIACIDVQVARGHEYRVVPGWSPATARRVLT